MKLGDIAKAYQTGVGNVLGFIAIVLGLGTMLGKLMAESGGAERLAGTMVRVFGEKRVHWVMMFVAFICGIPVFLQVGVVLLIPLVFTLAKKTGTSLIKIGIAMVAGLSVVHSLVPPHPAALAAVGILHADIGKTILLSLIVGLPSAAIAGPIFSSWIAKRVHVEPSKELMEQFSVAETRNLPGFGITLFTILLPIILMLITTVVDFTVPEGNVFRMWIDFIGTPITSLLIALLVAMYTFGFSRGLTANRLAKITNDCLAPTASIILIIGAGGGFNGVLTASGVGDAIAAYATSAHISLLFLGWIIAGLIRASVGSATVAMTTAAGIVAPIAATVPGTNLELLVLATGSGSIMLSHVNDSGFWLIKEYFNMSVADTLKTWTAMETILSFVSFGFILILSLFI
jgi:GntP family gluconate:H+ symporter